MAKSIAKSSQIIYFLQKNVLLSYSAQLNCTKLRIVFRLKDYNGAKKKNKKTTIKPLEGGGPYCVTTIVPLEVRSATATAAPVVEQIKKPWGNENYTFCSGARTRDHPTAHPAGCKTVVARRGVSVVLDGKDLSGWDIQGVVVWWYVSFCLTARLALVGAEVSWASPGAWWNFNKEIIYEW